MSDSETDYVAWAEHYSTQANEEGWSIFETDTEHPFELQRVDELALFADDADAWTHVVRQAKAGDACASGALMFLKLHSPKEYGAIMDATYADDSEVVDE